jgi:hypothetical protein
MAAAVVLLAFGALTTILSLQLPIGTPRAPDSGFFPLALGVMLVALAAAHIVQLRLAARSSDAPVTDSAGGPPVADGPAERRRVPWFMGAVVIATALLPVAGYAIVAFLLMAALLEILGMRPRWATALVALVTAGVCQLVFVRWLGIPLPGGWLWS